MVAGFAVSAAPSVLNLPVLRHLYADVFDIRFAEHEGLEAKPPPSVNGLSSNPKVGR